MMRNKIVVEVLPEHKYLAEGFNLTAGWAENNVVECDGSFNLTIRSVQRSRGGTFDLINDIRKRSSDLAGLRSAEALICNTGLIPAGWREKSPILIAGSYGLSTSTGMWYIAMLVFDDAKGWHIRWEWPGYLYADRYYVLFNAG